MAISQEAINTGLKIITRDGVYYTIFAIVIGSVFALIMARGLTLGVQHLVKVANKIGKGEDSARIHLERHDELGQLSSSLNNMLDTIISQKQETEKAQQALRDRESHLRTLIETVPDMIWLKDPDGIYLGCNPKFERFFGAKQREIIGKTDYDFVDKELADFFREKDNIAMAAGRPSVNEEEVTYADDGHKELLETIKTPMYKGDGTLIGILGIARDITERKEMELRLQQSHKMEAIGTMAGGIAHDFNNILAAVIGYAEMAHIETPSSSSAKSHIEQVLAAALRAKDLTRHILTFSRMSGLSHDHGPIDIVSVVKEVMDFQRSVIPSTIEIKANIDERCGQIIGDPTEIHQVIMNLCTNASHAMEGKSGVITVGLHKVELSKEDLQDNESLPAGTYIQISVNDTGVGIPQEYLGKIFDPYFTTKEVSRGSGMGLAVVHAIIKNHGGFINVESQEGKGSSFNAFFPKITASNEPDVPVVNDEMPTGNEKILFVDDEEMLVDLGEKMLESLGYSVTATTDSTNALELFRRDPSQFDLVITDQTMPKIPGSELAHLLLELRPDIPIILCTGYSSTIDEEQAREFGIKGYVMKPVDIRLLSRVIRSLLDSDDS